ncbi:hypothetical protein BC827DRAFT_1196090 [Russula dissimulans]|nr:hypothetical protein BC827DRAFT_1196090 [Russula dissimulans]
MSGARPRPRDGCVFNASTSAVSAIQLQGPRLQSHPILGKFSRSVMYTTPAGQTIGGGSVPAGDGVTGGHHSGSVSRPAHRNPRLGAQEGSDISDDENPQIKALEEEMNRFLPRGPPHGPSKGKPASQPPPPPPRTQQPPGPEGSKKRPPASTATQSTTAGHGKKRP